MFGLMLGWYWAVQRAVCVPVWTASLWIFIAATCIFPLHPISVWVFVCAGRQLQQLTTYGMVSIGRLIWQWKRVRVPTHIDRPSYRARLVCYQSYISALLYLIFQKWKLIARKSDSNMTKLSSQISQYARTRQAPKEIWNCYWSNLWMSKPNKCAYLSALRRFHHMSVYVFHPLLWSALLESKSLVRMIRRRPALLTLFHTTENE